MPSVPAYVELRCRSAFSFLDGASLPEDLAATAAALGYQAPGAGRSRWALRGAALLPGRAQERDAAAAGGRRRHAGASGDGRTARPAPPLLLLVEDRAGLQEPVPAADRDEGGPAQGRRGGQLRACWPNTPAGWSRWSGPSRARICCRLRDIFGPGSASTSSCSGTSTTPRPTATGARWPRPRRRASRLVATNDVRYAEPAPAPRARRAHLRPPEDHRRRGRAAAAAQRRALPEAARR